MNKLNYKINKLKAMLNGKNFFWQMSFYISDLSKYKLRSYSCDERNLSNEAINPRNQTVEKK